MKKLVMPLLLLSAAFVTPAYANYFSNPLTGVNLNVGSAPNPTPMDIRDNRMPLVAAPVAATPDATAAADASHEHNAVQPSGGAVGARPASPAH